MKRKSHEIALSGIAAALATVFIILARYVEFMTLSLNVLAAIMLMLPLAKGYIRGGILAYAAAALLGFLFANLNSLTFTIGFGVYTIVQWLLDQKLVTGKMKKIVTVPINIIVKLMVVQLGTLGIFALLKISLGDINILGWQLDSYVWIALIMTALAVPYDFLMRFVYKNLKYQIDKKID